ncbi:formylglycine-generating sulfatase enzyme [Leptospira meyeri serovar Hardjo str. Went 5]|uniref:formylglycine-generating enzyme family protein n=1 Tax=Leptospira meyeri TaxID=29508 RepID=UPI00028DF3D5|nr:formylglycine-generating enzyme family protein [Leptospira meyeri]EKJ86174.1 formylglycine-generating sulfatase enzyme [Leptospira meyeri serovar Hardjo str. Went 5]
MKYIFFVIVLALVTLNKSSIFSENINSKFKDQYGIEFILIPSGNFLMGCDEKKDKECFDSEKPKRKVTISKNFYISKFEVTQKQWEDVMGNNPSLNKECGLNCPVENVSWFDVQKYISKLNLDNERIYRLPTEAEWEYVANDKGIAEFSEKYIFENAWTLHNSKNNSQPVGKKKSNSFGVYDMLGNVWEWCDDWFDENLYINAPSIDPKGITPSTLKSARGGSFDIDGHGGLNYRPLHRFFFPPDHKSPSLGFRLVVTMGK